MVIRAVEKYGLNSPVEAAILASKAAFAFRAFAAAEALD
jgi:hypothetical protein